MVGLRQISSVTSLTEPRSSNCFAVEPASITTSAYFLPSVVVFVTPPKLGETVDDASVQTYILTASVGAALATSAGALGDAVPSEPESSISRQIFGDDVESFH